MISWNGVAGAALAGVFAAGTAYVDDNPGFPLWGIGAFLANLLIQVWFEARRRRGLGYPLLGDDIPTAILLSVLMAGTAYTVGDWIGSETPLRWAGTAGLGTLLWQLHGYRRWWKRS